MFPPAEKDSSLDGVAIFSYMIDARRYFALVRYTVHIKDSSIWGWDYQLCCEGGRLILAYQILS